MNLSRITMSQKWVRPPKSWQSMCMRVRMWPMSWLWDWLERRWPNIRTMWLWIFPLPIIKHSYWPKHSVMSNRPTSFQRHNSKQKYNHSHVLYGPQNQQSFPAQSSNAELTYHYGLMSMIGLLMIGFWAEDGLTRMLSVSMMMSLTWWDCWELERKLVLRLSRTIKNWWKGTSWSCFSVSLVLSWNPNSEMAKQKHNWRNSDSRTRIFSNNLPILTHHKQHQ